MGSSSELRLCTWLTYVHLEIVKYLLSLQVDHFKVFILKRIGKIVSYNVKRKGIEM